jgi:hypothetical protein
MPAFQIELRIMYERTVVQLGSNSTDFFFFNFSLSVQYEVSG